MQQQLSNFEAAIGNIQPVSLMEVQWAYVQQLNALGYEALRSRGGADELVHVIGPDGTSHLIRTIIRNDFEGENTVLVHTQALEKGSVIPWLSGFTMTADGYSEAY